MRTTHTYVTADFPGRTFTAREVMELAGRAYVNVAQYVSQGTPIAGHLFTKVGKSEERTVAAFGNEPRTIACRCELCGGKTWTVAEIRALPNTPITINPLTLVKASAVSGHQFYYPTGRPLGTWRKAKPAPRPAEAPREPHRYGSDPLVREMMAIQPKRLDLTFIAGAEGGAA